MWKSYIQESVLQKESEFKRPSKHDKRGHGIGIDSVKESWFEEKDGTIAFLKKRTTLLRM